ncbi:uncharacterized protein JCM6883_004850 [Sporobolomyces salmoneus]|uniref:uncharacterized protein n=1 Tax=Sporobolomyces salmoneus TaxID=183962 RepID=UPI00316B356F
MSSIPNKRKQLDPEDDDACTSTFAAPTALGGATGDYRDGQEYLPTGFGEIGQYLRNKRKKLIVQNQALMEDGQEYPQIFAGLRIYINGYTDSIGLGELTEILIRHGGRYVPYLDRKDLVTHIIATNLTPTKRKEFASYKVATPDWLTDSVKEGKLLDWRSFSLLAPDKGGSPRKTGWEEEKDPLGTQTGQKTLFGMLSKSNRKEEEASSNRPSRPPVASTSKQNVETIESLSQRGARLARAVVLEQQQAGSSSIKYFLQPHAKPRNAAPRPQSTTTTSAPITDSLSATTDSPLPPDAVTRNWLPQKARDSRTTALINDPDWLSKHTSASEDFLQSYFAQSRLHHLSSFKEDLKILAASRQVGKEPNGSRRLTGTAADGRTVMHADFDCFFVAAGLTSRPELRGKPVAVCHARGLGDSLSSTSEIASCSYEARAFGVKNGMSLGRARELCPAIQTMPFEFERYREFSLKFYDILLAHAELLEAVSMDEVLLEVKVPPTVSRDQDPALDLAFKIRSEIFEATGCPASIGISHNVLLARLATRRAKPASAYHLFPEDVTTFLEPLTVDSLPGIGWSLRAKLADELKVSTVGQLLRTSEKKLEAIGSGNAKKFLAFARGIDDRELKVEQVRKSVSAEVNYGIRFEEGRNDQVERFVRELATEVARRLRQEGLKAGSLSLKVMVRHPEAPVDTPKLLGHGWVDTHTKNSALRADGRQRSAVDDPELIAKTAWNLMKSLKAPPHELRGIGITLQKLEKDGQSVDVAMEKGQSKLSFAAPPPQVSRSRSSESAPSAPSSREVSAPPLAPPAQSSRSSTTPEVIVLDDSDSDEEPTIIAKPRVIPSPRRDEPTRQRSMKPPQKKEVYIPQQLFSTKSNLGGPPSASQVSDAELEHYGLDPEVFRSLDPELQRDELAYRRKHKLRYVPKKDKQKVAVKAKPPAAKVQAPIPSVLVLSPSSPAVREEDKTVAFLQNPAYKNLPPDVLRDVLPALGPATQRNVINMYKLRVSGNGPTTRDESTTTRNQIDVRIRPEPQFSKLTQLDDIEERLEQWVTMGRDQLNEEDIDRLGGFLEKCVMRDKGHNLSKAVDLLRYWRILLEDEFGKKDSIQAGGSGRAWWEGFERTLKRVDYVVYKETSAHLRV